jgi:hypothetical protein
MNNGDVVCYQSKIDINQKKYLVRVMVNEAVTPVKVVTVYRTTERVESGNTGK